MKKILYSALLVTSAALTTLPVEAKTKHWPLFAWPGRKHQRPYGLYGSEHVLYSSRLYLEVRGRSQSDGGTGWEDRRRP